MPIKEKIELIRADIKPYPNVKFVVATKYMNIEQTQALIDAGITELGENRTDLFLEKYEIFKDYPIKWHFFGVVQSRKIRDIVNRIDCLHSLEKLSTAMELDKRLSKPLDCFIQINISDEPNKQGIPYNKTKSFVRSLGKCKNIRVIGLMCIAKLTADTDVIRQEFQKMADMKKEVEAMQLEYAPCHELSMGMSNDYKIALEYGATVLRLGRIFIQ
ncbi:MAG: YggS family pyridoxal phosphate-dependent enzyme [Bacilli bacterium]